MRPKFVLGGIVAALALAIVGFVGSAAEASPEAVKVLVPNVVGLRMDQSTRLLHAKRLRVNEECSGLFGCVVKSNWWVCAQTPRAGSRVRRYSVVFTYGARKGEC